MDTDYYEKYIKYKNKYFELKYELQTGNGSLSIPADKDGYTLIIFNHKDINPDSVLFYSISASCVNSEFSKDKIGQDKIDCSNNFRDINDKLPKSYELFNSDLKMALWLKLNNEFKIIDKFPNIEKKGIKIKSQGIEINGELKNKSVIDNNTGLEIIKQLIKDNLLQHSETDLGGGSTKSYDVLICKIAGLTGSNQIIKIRQIKLPIS